MAWAEKMPSGKYRGNYRVAGKVRSAGTFTRKRDAVAKASEKENEQRQPDAIDPRSGKLSWGQWVDEHWWSRRRVEESTKARDRSRLEQRLRPQWGHREIGGITRAEVEDWVLDLSSTGQLRPGTVVRCYHLFSASMTAAVTARKIASSPCVKIPLPHEPPPDENFLTRDQVEALVWAMPKGIYKTLVYLAVNTGMRWGELAALHWQRTDLDELRTDIALAWDTRNLTYKLPKTRERRSVPLPEWLGAELEDHAERYPPRERCAKEHPPALGSRCTSSLVLPGRFHGPLHYNTFHSGVWLPACRKAGLHASPHDLRHTYASWLLQSRKVTLEGLSKLMGHASILTTMRYAHLADTQWDGARDALARPTSTPALVVPDAATD